MHGATGEGYDDTGPVTTVLGLYSQNQSRQGPYRSSPVDWSIDANGIQLP